MAVQQDEFKKRRKLRQRRIRRRRILIGTIVLFICALITGIVLSLTVLFPVSVVNASGSKIYTPEQIVEASELGKKDNIFTFSSAKLEERLQSKLPYVEKIKIKRRLPDTVNISVSDAKEFACFPIDGEYFTVSRSKRVLNKYAECPEGLFIVRTDNAICVPGEELKFSNIKTEKNIYTIIEELLKHEININEVDITNPLSLTVKVENRFIVDFGTSGSLEKKIAHLSGMIKNIGEGRTGKINLSMWTSDKTEGTFTETPIN